MLDFRKVIEVDENQVRTRVIGARVDDGGGADGVEGRSGELRAFADVPVERPAGPVFLDLIPQGVAADVAAVE